MHLSFMQNKYFKIKIHSFNPIFEINNGKFNDNKPVYYIKSLLKGNSDINEYI